MSAGQRPPLRRAGRRQALRAAAVTHADAFLTRTMKPVEIVSEEGLDIITQNAETILAEVGIEVRDIPRRWPASATPAATSTVSGCASPAGSPARSWPRHRRVTSNTPEPRSRRDHRRRRHRVRSNYGSPFVHDLDGGRRYATLADFENFVKLTYLSPNLHHSGGTVCEPVDMPVSKRHLDMVYSHLRLSDKPIMGSVTAGEGAPTPSSWPASPSAATSPTAP